MFGPEPFGSQPIGFSGDAEAPVVPDDILSINKVWTEQELSVCLDGKRWTHCAPGNEPL